ncbi:hypothetical protein CON95_27155 [Bacillus toyonensis]|uniref:YccF domain-containing protein n=1 Tax=Bacillus toyonensis TaxID=155322 RepID=UPI000BECDDAF|nr:YccF domain-containing protein [Bacillus toyonensis]PEE20775.1 hypothetical protein CON95_27155 [Bacillus toyonensis]
MSEPRGQQIIHCKKCGSNKISLTGKWTVVATAFLTGCVLCLFIITIPIAVLCWIVAAIFMFVPFRSAKCQECKHNQKVDQEKFDELKAYLRS